MDQSILADVSTIAASADGTDGDGSLAAQISLLGEERIMSGNTSTMEDYFAILMGTLGTQSQEATFMRENQELMVEQVQSQKNSTSGVSLDEEMINLMKYQRAYEAAAKLVATVDEVMETVINMV